MATQFPVKATMDDNTYQKLLSEKCFDILKNPLKIGDKVAYATARKHSGPVSVGEIVEMWMEYSEKWDYNTKMTVPDYGYIYTYIKIKGLKQTGSRGGTRNPDEIVRVG